MACFTALLLILSWIFMWNNVLVHCMHCIAYQLVFSVIICISIGFSHSLLGRVVDKNMDYYWTFHLYPRIFRVGWAVYWFSTLNSFLTLQICVSTLTNLYVSTWDFVNCISVPQLGIIYGLKLGIFMNFCQSATNEEIELV